MSEAPILSTLESHVLTLTLNRPERLNALSTGLLTAAKTALDEGVAAGATLSAYYHPLFDTLAALDIPVVSALNGPAVGAGMALALAADIVVMAHSAYLQLAFANIGLVPDAGATWLVAKSAGRAKALEMALLGEAMSAQEAKDAGLVARVVGDGALMDEAFGIACRLARGPTVAIGLIRKQVAAALNASLVETMALEAANQTRAGRTEDFREAVAAFRDKRAPEFRGR